MAMLGYATTFVQCMSSDNIAKYLYCNHLKSNFKEGKPYFTQFTKHSGFMVVYNL